MTKKKKKNIEFALIREAEKSVDLAECDSNFMGETICVTYFVLLMLMQMDLPSQGEIKEMYSRR